MEAILRHDALRQARDAMAGLGGEHSDQVVTRLIDSGCYRREVLEMVQAVCDHMQGPGDDPYARGRCINCGAVQVAWSEYHWDQWVRTPCRNRGRNW